MLNVIKIIVVLALLAFLVFRMRGRTTATTSTGKRTAAPPKQLRSRANPLARLRRKKAAPPAAAAAQPRMRPRLTVALPHATPSATLDESVLETADPRQVDSAEAQAPAAVEPASVPVTPDGQDAPVSEPVDEAPPTEVPAHPVTNPGWPVPGEFSAPIDFDAFDPDPESGAPEAANAHAATEPADVLYDDWTPALAEPVSSEPVTWTEVNALETGVDDEATAVDGSYPPADDAGWSDDDSFDPASGWADEEESEGAWSTPTVRFDEADPAQIADWDTRDPVEAPTELTAADAQLEAWDASDWNGSEDAMTGAGGPAPPAYAAADADEWDEGADELIPPTTEDSGAVLAHDEPLAWTDAVPDESVAPIEASFAVPDAMPAVDEPATSDERPAADHDLADLVTPIDAVAVDELQVAPTAETLPALGDPLPADAPGATHGQELAHTLWDFAAPADAPADAGGAPTELVPPGLQDLQVAVERDDFGNPTAWVLSGSALGVDGVVRVTVPTPNADATATIAAADLPQTDEPDPAETAHRDDAAFAALLGDTPASASPAVELAPPVAAASPEADAIAELTRRLANAEREIAELRSREAVPVSATDDTAPPPAPARRPRAKKVAAGASRTSTPRTPRAATATPQPSKRSVPVPDAPTAGLSIAELVQAEANRRVAAVLAEHGAVKANGDFTGLVDRLEHVSEHDPSGSA